MLEAPACQGSWNLGSSSPGACRSGVLGAACAPARAVFCYIFVSPRLIFCRSAPPGLPASKPESPSTSVSPGRHTSACPAQVGNPCGLVVLLV